ncbi:hypothetical protein G7075_14770 [Phycicoccus sp. HDW14]|uniref:hypothetical protein n=1 Tax=Phycicoccus sp. HDW14 TaxID=2714941 RepID=UPI001408E0C3|nr:hypothetical protein [Phycicoccus sp. HDW14]QIM22105.1 hypothetical protein G7075_14770 [Phycicoccus sp. HDW14]
MVGGAAPGMTVARARDWTAGADARWRRGLLVLAGVCAFGVSVLGDDAGRCSPRDPTVCGPDPLFSAAVVLAVAAVVLVWWWPTDAAVCAVVFAVLDIRFDDVLAANLAWTALALLHVGHVVLVRREVADRRRALARAHAPVPRPASWGSPVLERDPGLPLGPRQLAVVALVTVAVACLGVLAQQLAAQGAHEARARTVPAVVVADVGVDAPAYRVRLAVPQPDLPSEYVVETIDEYEVGEPAPLVLDPLDPGWAHLAAEPPDVTWWLSLAVAALLLAVVLGRRLVQGRVHRAALAHAVPESGVPVRWVEVDDDVVPLLATDQDVVVAELVTVPRPRLAGADAPRLEQLVRPGWLVGDVRDGGWCGLVHAGGLELPAEPLVALPELPRVDDTSLDPELAEDVATWSEPVPPDTVRAALPAVLAPTLLERLVGIVAVLGAPAVAGWMLGWPETSWWQGLGLCSVALTVTHWGLERAAASARVTPEAIELTDPLWCHRVPLSAVSDVRVAGDDLVVLVGDDDEDDGLVVGPWVAGPGARRAVVPTAASVAAAVDDRRPVVRPSPRTAPPVERRLSPTAPVLALVVAALVVRYVAVLVL